MEKTNFFDNEILKILPVKIRNIMEQILTSELKRSVEEINIRVGKPVIIRIGNTKGRREIVAEYIISNEDMRETLGYISNFSMYAYEEEVKEGFLTIKGGHRIGISGRTVMADGEIKTIKNITSLNIRIARQIKGCADNVMDIIMSDGFENTLIISPPCMGKTTLLREMVRILSDKYHYKIGVVDERGEIAACYMGIAQNDIGQRCDVMDGCRKDKGVMMLIRSMSPDIIAVDELGSEKDIETLHLAGSYGGKILATIHGKDISSVTNKRFMSDMMDECFFKNYIVINEDRTMKIYDENGIAR